MENSPLRFLKDNDVIQKLNDEVDKSKKKFTLIYHINLYENRLSNINYNSKDIIDDLIWRINKLTTREDDSIYSYHNPIKKNIHVQGYVNMLEDFLLETMSLIRLPCGTISNGAQCMCDICLGIDDY